MSALTDLTVRVPVTRVKIGDRVYRAITDGRAPDDTVHGTIRTLQRDQLDRPSRAVLSCVCHARPKTVNLSNYQRVDVAMNLHDPRAATGPLIDAEGIAIRNRLHVRWNHH